MFSDWVNWIDWIFWLLPDEAEKTKFRFPFFPPGPLPGRRLERQKYLVYPVILSKD
jgi:hypothetical protein